MQNEPAFLSFVAAVAALREEWRVSQGFTFAENFGASFEVPKGAKFARVYSTEAMKGGAVRKQIYAFVALEDSTTKGLGAVKRGDVMKPATYKAPARHARGNVYDSTNGLATCNSFGPGYLR